jgi:hypothetical protein
VPWKFVEKLFFNHCSISGLILLGKACTLNFAIAFEKGFSFFSWVHDRLWKKNAAIVNLDGKPILK